MTLTETRYASSPVSRNSTRGFVPSLETSGHDNLIHGRETITYNFDKVGSDILGERSLEVILFKDDNDLDPDEVTSRGKSRFVQSASGNKDTTGREGIQQDHAVMFTVNGQTHGDQGVSFLKNRCGYSKVGDDTVVIMRFDDFANPDMSDLFKPTRDRLQDGKQESKRLLTGLEDALQSSDMLSEEEERRRARRGSDEAQFDTKSFEEFVSSNPDIAPWVTSGQKITGPRPTPRDAGEDVGTGDRGGDGEGPGEDEARSEPLKIPTYIRPIKEYDSDGDHEYWDESAGGTMDVEIPVNSTRKVRFETDAQDDYLTRDTLGGEFKVSNSRLRRATEVHDGILTLTLEPVSNASVGDSELLTVRLTRPDIGDIDLGGRELDMEDPSEADHLDLYRALLPETGEVTSDPSSVDTSPLYGHVDVVYGPQIDKPESTPSGQSGGSSGNSGDEGDSGSDGNGSTQDSGMEIPTVQMVYREDWDFDPDDPDFDIESLEKEPSEIDVSVAREFDETITMRLEPSPDDSISGLTLTVNMDSAPLRTFIQDRNVKETWKEFVENQYQNAVVFFTISQYRELQETQGEDLTEREIGVTDIIENCVNGMGQVLLPVIFSSDELDRMTE